MPDLEQKNRASLCFYPGARARTASNNYSMYRWASFFHAAGMLDQTQNGFAHHIDLFPQIRVIRILQ
jgi:hypothetical protein